MIRLGLRNSRKFEMFWKKNWGLLLWRSNMLAALRQHADAVKEYGEI